MIGGMAVGEVVITAPDGLQYGSKGGADNVMFCLPAASMDGIAYAYINWCIRVYSANW